MNNVELLKRVNKIDDIEEQLDTNKKELTDKINEVATTGTTVEVIEKTTQSQIDKYIDDGTIARMTIEDWSVTKEKLDIETDLQTINLIYHPFRKITNDYFLNNEGGTTNFSGSYYVTIPINSINYNKIYLQCTNKINNTNFGCIRFLNSEKSIVKTLTTEIAPSMTIDLLTTYKYMEINIKVLSNDYNSILYVGYHEFKEGYYTNKKDYFSTLFNKNIIPEKSLENEKKIEEIEEIVSNLPMDNVVCEIPSDVEVTAPIGNYIGANTYYANNATTDKEVYIKNLIITATNATTGDHTLNVIIYDNELNVTAKQSVIVRLNDFGEKIERTIPLSNYNLTIPKNGYIAFMFPSANFLMTYGTHSTNTIYALTSPEIGEVAEIKQRVSGALNYKIEVEPITLSDKLKEIDEKMSNIPTDNVVYEKVKNIEITAPIGNTIDTNTYYTNNTVFDYDIYISTLSMTATNTVTGIQTFNIAIYDSELNVVKKETIKFSVSNTGEKIERTIPLSNYNLTIPKNGYIGFMFPNVTFRMTFGNHSTNTIYALTTTDVGSTAEIKQRVSGALNYKIESSKKQILTEVLDDKINKDDVNEYINNYILEYLAEYTNINNLLGKSWNVIGDSISRGHSLEVSQTYNGVISARNQMDLVNYAQNGKMLTGEGNDYGLSIVKDYINMRDNVDYVTVFAGTNDKDVELGEKDSTDINTIYGTLNVLCDGLLTKYPTSKIFFITPMNFENNSKIEEIVNAIKEVCGKFSIPVLDLYHEGTLCPKHPSQLKALMLNETDRLHPSIEGHKHIATRIEAFMRNL